MYLQVEALYTYYSTLKGQGSSHNIKCLINVLQVEGYEEILIETINLCCYYFENNMYMVPKEKYMLLKVFLSILLQSG